MGPEVDAEITAEDILSDKPFLPGFGQRIVHPPDPVDVLTPNVDIDVAALHGPGGNESPLNEKMGIVLEDHPVLEGAGLRFVPVAGQVAGASVRFGHEGPFQSGIETGTAPSA